jgi:hypothetical protein
MSEVNYKNQLAAEQARQEQDARERQEDAEWSKIVEIYDLADHEANRNVVAGYCAPDDITLSAFEFMVANGAAEQRLDWKPQKGALINQIIDLLTDPTERRHTQFTLKQERSKMSTWSTAQLRERLRKLQYAQSIAPKTADQIRADLKAHRAAQETNPKFPGWPRLPKSVVKPGTVTSVLLDAAYIRDLSSFEIRRLNEIYSPEQINARIAGRA